MDNFSVDERPEPGLGDPATPLTEKLRRLAGAASHLCLAERELRLAGYSTWPEQLDGVLQAIALEIAFLEGPPALDLPRERTS